MEDVSRELGLLFRSLKGMHAAVLAEAGLRVELPAAAVLLTLQERGQVRLSAVAETLAVDLSSVSRQVAALERDGWVSRRRDPDDSRAVLLELTPAGRDVLARLRAARAAHLRRLLPDWTEADLAGFASSLHRFRTDLTTPAPDRTPVHADPALDPTPVLAGQEST
jgi:DNA-binding MarR family transcriptional regulator